MDLETQGKIHWQKGTLKIIGYSNQDILPLLQHEHVQTSLHQVVCFFALITCLSDIACERATSTSRVVLRIQVLQYSGVLVLIKAFSVTKTPSIRAKFKFKVELGTGGLL